MSCVLYKRNGEPKPCTSEHFIHKPQTIYDFIFVFVCFLGIFKISINILSWSKFIQNLLRMEEDGAFNIEANGNLRNDHQRATMGSICIFQAFRSENVGFFCEFLQKTGVLRYSSAL